MKQNTIICGQELTCEDTCCCGCKPDQSDIDVFDNIEVDATVDDTIGTPSVNVTHDKENNKLTFAFSGIKGEVGETGSDGQDGQSITYDSLTEEQKNELKGPQGERGPQGDTGATGDTGAQGPKGYDGIDGAPGTYPQLRAQANIGNTVGNPSVRVTVEGTNDSPILNFYFDGIKGANGTNGINGTNGRDGRDGIDGRDATIEQIEDAVAGEIERQLDEFDDALEAASWLKYAINGYEDSKQSFARLIAAAREYDSTGKTKLDEAYAGVNALVTKNNDGTYTATSFLTSLVGGGEGEPQSQSGFITTSNLSESIADMYSTYNTNTATAVARIFAIASQQGSTLSLTANQIRLNNILNITESGITSGDPLNIQCSEDIVIKTTSGDENSEICFVLKRMNEDTAELEDVVITVSEILEMKDRLDAIESRLGIS